MPVEIGRVNGCVFRIRVGCFCHSTAGSAVLKFCGLVGSMLLVFCFIFALIGMQLLGTTRDKTLRSNFGRSAAQRHLSHAATDRNILRPGAQRPSGFAQPNGPTSTQLW